MLLFILIITGIAFFIARFYLNVRKLPPGPTPLPLIGNLHQVIYGAYFQGGGVMAKWKKKYGHVTSFWLGPLHTVNICDLAAAQEVFVKNGAAFEQRYLPFFLHHLRQGMGILFSNGQHWAEQRKFAFQALRNFGLGKGIMEEKIMLEVDYRFEELDKTVEENGGSATFDPDHFIHLLVGNIINQLLTSERFIGDREKIFWNLMAAVKEMNDISILDLLMTEKTVGLPILRKRAEKSRQPQTKIIAHFKEIIKQRRLDIESGAHELKDEGDDFLDAFLMEMNRRKDRGDVGSFFEQSLEMTLFDLWLGGQETSSTTLLWALSYLLLNPGVLEKLVEEMDDITGGRRSLSLADKTNTPYLNAVITETLRVSSLVPASLGRVADSDVIAGGFLLPKGSVVTAQMAVIMADDNTFENPAKFDPSRFFTENRLDQHVLAFGIGRRACPGESLARAELYLVLGNVVSRYKIESVGGSLPQMKAKDEMGAVRHAQNFQICFRKRISAR